jgi:hypothetical protein
LFREVPLGDKGAQTQSCYGQNQQQDLQRDHELRILGRGAQHQHCSNTQQQDRCNNSSQATPDSYPNNRQKEQIKKLVASGEVPSKHDPQGQNDAAALRQRFPLPGRARNFQMSLGSKMRGLLGNQQWL